MPVQIDIRSGLSASDLQKALNGFGVDRSPVSEAHPQSRFLRLRLKKLVVLRVREPGNPKVHVSTPPDTVMIIIPCPSAGIQTWSGRTLGTYDTLLVGPEHTVTCQSHDLATWSCIFEPVDEYLYWRAALLGQIPEIPATPTIATWARPNIRRINQILDSATRLAIKKPAFLAHGEAIRSFELELLGLIGADQLCEPDNQNLPDLHRTHFL